MDKYTLLLLLNIPLVIYGFAKAWSGYSKASFSVIDLVMRLVFWSIVLSGLWFAEEIYNYLLGHNLTDSSPLSIADVVLVTGLSFCLFLIIRLYTKIDRQERQFTELHEKLSMALSERKK